MKTPYASATSGDKARNEISSILRKFGCSSIGYMDDFENGEVILEFTHRGRTVSMRVSAKGWAAMFLKENPWTGRRRQSQEEYQRAAVAQGTIAVNSILRDWIKGQITAVECGVLSFEAVFMPHMLTADGRTLLQIVEERKLLPPPN